MKLLLVGGGNMGSALFAGWQKSLTNLHVTVIEPFMSDRLRNLCGTAHTCVSHADDVSGVFDAVILAIKPQGFSDILPSLVPFMGKDTFVLSIAAGKSLDGMAELLGDDVAIIRTMPNTPALIGEGISVLVANTHVTAAQKELATLLMDAVGKTIWIADEQAMHAVTALSGSGPAYVFAMIEAMQQAGETLGLSPEMSLELARQTVKGAALLAESQPDTAPAELRRQVTSPGGTTEAALNVLLDVDGLGTLMRNAIRAAAQRSRDLA